MCPLTWLYVSGCSRENVLVGGLGAIIIGFVLFAHFDHRSELRTDVIHFVPCKVVIIANLFDFVTLKQSCLTLLAILGVRLSTFS